MMLKIRVAVLIYFGVWLNKETGVPQMPTLCFLQIKTKMYKKNKKKWLLNTNDNKANSFVRKFISLQTNISI